ncbi:MAG: hypothetical protein DWI10_09620 [Planctomycetota bacterium]|nr:MAG: hypothetical protein DWI10_09620 [Planctomycetota bacterium]
MDRLPHIPWLTAAATPPRHALSDRQTRQIVALLADQFEPIGTDSKRVRAALALVALGIFALLIHDRALNGSLPAFPIGEAEIGSHTSGVGKMNHNTVRALAAGMMSVGIATVSANAQSAVQWRVEDGGNGHWYADDNRPTFNSFAVRQAQYVAIGAHLATVTSAAEHSYVLSVAFPTGQLLASDTWPALGASRLAGETVWNWVSGETVDYWPFVKNPPNTTLNYLMMWGSGSTPSLTWTGNGNTTLQRAIIEWSADCNNDSIIDYGQILAGELEDLNANNIPDCCEGGVPCSCPADLDGNGEINSSDLEIILDKFGTDGGKDYPNADIDGSGIVDAADLTAILSGWGACR